MMHMLRGSFVAATAVAIAAACSSGGAGDRKVEITQGDDGCSPVSIAVSGGEKLNLVVKNASTKDSYALEAVSGPTFGVVAVPQGKSRQTGYAVPDGDGVYTLQCFVPGGVSTSIEVVAGPGGRTALAAKPTSTPAATSAPKAPDAEVAVTLIDFTVTPDKPSVKAGTIKFNATTGSTSQEHELVLHRINDDGSRDFAGEATDIHAGETKSVTLDLPPGTYELACFIVSAVPDPNAPPTPTRAATATSVAGATPEADPDTESNTPVPNGIDHYQKGMHVAFRVE